MGIGSIYNDSLEDIFLTAITKEHHEDGATAEETLFIPRLQGG